MNYIETMNYITNTAKFGSNLGLERTEKILELLGRPHKFLRFIHVGGSNGKGSTTAMINRILMENGYNVGMYTSPYLEEFEERIQINGINIPQEDLCEVVTDVADVVDKVVLLGFGNPTEFEIITCAMFLYFYKKKVDFAVIEVGLGGRLDSTNVIVPMVSVITSISFDHMEILGNTLKEIALEKAGIIKCKIPVVLYPQLNESLRVIERVCEDKCCKLIRIQEDSAIYLDTEKFVQHIIIKTKIDSYEIELPLLGKHQLLNCSVAIGAIESLILQGVRFQKENIINALKKVKWIGRLEVIGTEPLVVIDGAHNIDGIRKLKESIDIYFKYNKLILVLGILADKQVEEMVKAIATRAYRVIAVAPRSEGAEQPHELKKIIEKVNKNCECFLNYEEAFSKALQYCGRSDLLLVSGSLYMIGDMRKIIKSRV